jgi:hypothetical protein
MEETERSKNMGKGHAMKRKIVGAVISAALMATAFQPGGCTLTVDQDTVNQVMDWLDNLDTSSGGSTNPAPIGPSSLTGTWQHSWQAGSQ